MDRAGTLYATTRIVLYAALRLLMRMGLYSLALSLLFLHVTERGACGGAHKAWKLANVVRCLWQITLIA